MRIIWVIIALSIAGCIMQSNEVKGELVKVTYSVWGGIVSEENYRTIYEIDNNQVSFTKMTRNGSVSYHSNTSITDEEYKRIGLNIVDAGIFNMLDEYNGTAADYKDGTASALIEVDIDGKTKSVRINPYVEKYAPGNVQKILFEVKRVTQGIQR